MRLRMRNFTKFVPDLMARAKMTQAQFGLEVGATQGTVSRWIRKGAVPKPHQQEAIENFAARLEGRPASDKPYRVKVDGRVGAGAVIEPDAEDLPPDGLYEIDAPFPVPLGSHAFEIVGDSMRPRYEPGDVIVCWRQISNPSELVGKEAIVQTDDGKRFLKRVRHGRHRNTFDLHSHNGQPPIEGVRLEWAAAIGAILPSGVWLPVQSRRLQGGEKFSRNPPI